MPHDETTQIRSSSEKALKNNIMWILGVVLIGCATGIIADAFVVGESIWRPIAIGANGSVFFIGLRLWMTGITDK